MYGTYGDTPGPAKPLVVIGSVNADLALELDRLPAPGETVGSRSLSVFPGGKGANQACAAARLGHPTRFVGQVGRDAYGPMLRGALEGAGVDAALLSEVDGPSGVALVLLQPGGENSIILVGGANQSEEWEITDAASAAVQAAGAVLLQREVPDVVNVIFAKIAASARVPVILDAGGADAPLSDDLLAVASVFSPNETELARATGLPTRSEKQCVAAAEALVHRGADKVLVKMGAKGSVLVDIRGNVVRVPAAPTLHVVDTTGAGDCFTAAYAVAMLEGKPDAEAMAWAATAAALCIQRQGAIPSMPTRAEVERELAVRSGKADGGGDGDDSSSSGASDGGGGGGGAGGGPRRGPFEETPTPPKRSSFW